LLHTFLKNNRAVTLIELVVSVSLISLILISVFNFYSHGIETYNEDFQRLIIQQNVRQAFGKLSSCLRLAKAYEIISPHKVKIITPDDNVVFYYLENDQLYREKNGVKNPVAEIKNISFQALNKKCIEIKLIHQNQSDILELSSTITPLGIYINQKG